MAQDSHEELKCEVRKVGYHEDRAKQFKTHLKMDEETYRKTVDGVLDYILKLNPKISLDEAIYFCGAWNRKSICCSKRSRNKLKAYHWQA